MSGESTVSTNAGDAGHTSVDDATLVLQLRGGHEAASRELVRRYSGRLLAVARRFLHCEHDAADAVQDAFVSALRSIHEFEGHATLGTWLHRIVVNACLMKLRSARRSAAQPLDLVLHSVDESSPALRRAGGSDDAPPEQLANLQLRGAVRACIEQLPEAYRVVIQLRDLEECNTEETARRLSVSQAAVKVRLHRARNALRKQLEQVLEVDHGLRVSPRLGSRPMLARGA